jgi:MFS family permease
MRGLTHYKWGLRIAIAAATIGVIYGYDLGAISGALLFVTKDFDLSTKETEWVATIVVAGSIVGALAGGRLANAIGRKPAMVLVALTYAEHQPSPGHAPRDSARRRSQYRNQSGPYGT